MRWKAPLHPSCPRNDTPPRNAAGTPSSRASTSFLRTVSEKDVDGRDKPAMTPNSWFNIVRTAAASTKAAGNAREYALLVVLAIVWGASYAFIRVGVATIPPVTLIAARTLIGSSTIPPHSIDPVAGTIGSNVPN